MDYCFLRRLLWFCFFWKLLVLGRATPYSLLIKDGNREFTIQFNDFIEHFPASHVWLEDKSMIIPWISSPILPWFFPPTCCDLQPLAFFHMLPGNFVWIRSAGLSPADFTRSKGWYRVIHGELTHFWSFAINIYIYIGWWFGTSDLGYVHGYNHSELYTV